MKFITDKLKFNVTELNQLVLLLIFTAVSILLYFQYIRSASFYTDDWYIIGHINQVGFKQTLFAYWPVGPRRPFMWLYYVISYWLMNHFPMCAATLIVVMHAIVCWLFYKLLLLFYVDKKISLISSAIVLVSPIADSVRLWFAGSVVNLSIGIFFVALIVLAKTPNTIASPSAICRKAAVCCALLFSTVFFIISALTYEAIMPFILFIIILAYGQNWAWYKFIPPFVALILVVVFYSLVTTKNTPGYPIPTFQYILDRLEVFGILAPASIGKTFGFDGDGFGVSIIGVTVITFAYIILTKNFSKQSKLIYVCFTIWLLGYVPFLAAPSYMNPLSEGWNNRINGFSVFGAAIFAPALMAFWYRQIIENRLLNTNRISSKNIINIFNFISIILLGVFFSNLIKVNARHQSNWILAGKLSHAVADGFVHSAFPLLSCGSVDKVVGFGIPLAVSEGVWVFENHHAFSAMLQTVTDCNNVSGVMVDGYRSINCLRDSMQVTTTAEGTLLADYKYGEALAYNFLNRTSFLISDEATCDTYKKLYSN